MARVMIEDFVKRRLGSPGTVKFPGLFSGDRREVEELSGGRYRLRSYVDSQNAFGALIRTSFEAVVREGAGGAWDLESLTFE